jgi:hypothetical protein
MQKFVMVPAGSVNPGDVVAVAGTPTRYAQPLAEVNRLDDGRVKLVFIEKSVVGDHGIRVAGAFSDQFPVALICDVEASIAKTVERWLSAASGD